MKIVFCTAHGAFSQDSYFRDLLPRLKARGHAVELAAIRAGARRTPRKVRVLLRLLGWGNVLQGALASFLYARAGINGLLRDTGVTWRGFPSVNGAEFRTHIREMGADLVINNQSEFFKAETLALPRHGVLNIHLGDLPDYRSYLPTYWAMMDGRTSFGVSAHFMVETIDAGDLAGKRLIDGTGLAMLDIMAALNREAVDLVLEVVDRLAEGQRPGEPMPQRPYRPLPTLDEAAEFHRRGLKVGRMTWRSRTP
ncbi:MAG: hypothetical protein H7841_05480 [Magnetospirillum sp. WYHS-4]